MRYSRKQFNWKKNEPDFAEASSLGNTVGKVPNVFSIISERTNKVVDFIFDHVIYTEDEVMGWAYRAANNSIKVGVIILND